MAVDIQKDLQNPGGKFELTAHRDPFPTQSFDRDEAQLLQSQLNTLITNFDNSVLTQLVEQRQNTIAKVAALAKAEFDGKTFGGINAGDNELGFSVLRPGHILETGGSAIVSDNNDWYADPAGSTGWVDWIGNGTTNYTVGTDTNAQVILLLGIVDQETGPTEISGYNIESFGRNMDMLPRDINSARLRDNETEQQVVPTPAFVARENDDVYALLRFDRDTERQPRAFGFNFSLGSFLDSQDY